jgi:hypothetical protein
VLALLWLVLMARLLRCLADQDPALYARLGQPVMRLPGASIPEPRSGPGPFVSLTGLSQGRLELRSLYGPEELVAAARLWAWIAFSWPRPTEVRAVRRLQRQLRWCGSGCLLGLAALLWLAVRGLVA